MSSSRQRKGISPLIAAVLLIAFTMMVASILTVWISNLTNQSTRQVGNKTLQLIDCAYGAVSIYEAVWDSAALTLDVTLSNIGTKDFSGVVVTYVTPSGSVGGTSNIGALAVAQTISLPTPFSSVTVKPRSVIVRTTDCQGVSDETVNIRVI